ncbi:MAG: HlyD family efflux transporter periplasmic adaptor subunit [Myxococcales bacterium]|nr:HlyD family efflux transporter periplasmic adaptor subunit [Myxococcales bacterium]
MDIRLRRTMGSAVWGVGLVVAMIWGTLDGAGAEGVGYGFSPPINVAALETGRIRELPVGLHDAVAPDQVVARLDPGPLVEARKVAEAELLAVQDDAVATAMNDARRFAEGVQGMLVDRARLSADLQQDLALAQTLRERLSLEEDLASSGASSSQAVEDWRRQLRVVEARISVNRSAVAAASRAADEATDRRDALREAPWSVVAATRSIEALDGRIARMDLRAGIDGQVSWIYRAEGEVVNAGDPVLQIRHTSTDEIVAFFPAASVTGMSAGTSATIRRSTGQVITGTLVSVGAGPQPLPAHLWQLPDWPEYGVPVVVHVDQQVAPDEKVTVRI